MSEIAPRKIRGAIVSGYQFAITIGLLLASCVNYGTQNLNTSASYRIPIGIQLLWPMILGTGLFFLPDVSETSRGSFRFVLTVARPLIWIP